MTATDDLTQAVARIEAHLTALTDDAVPPDQALTQTLAIAETLVERQRDLWKLRDQAIFIACRLNDRRVKGNRPEEGTDQ